MNTKEMREYLKDKVETVPRSNADVELLYNKLSSTDKTETSLTPIKDKNGDNLEKSFNAGEEYTYIGYGPTPPHMINFMGMQTFIRGQAVRVTDPRVLKKLEGHRCFVKGKADADEMYQQDELAQKRAEKIREEDLKLQIEVERKNRAMK